MKNFNDRVNELTSQVNSLTGNNNKSIIPSIPNIPIKYSYLGYGFIVFFLVLIVILSVIKPSFLLDNNSIKFGKLILTSLIISILLLGCVYIGFIYYR